MYDTPVRPRRILPMKRLVSILICLALALPALQASASDVASQWAQWRGPLASGVAPDADPPLTWSETENVRWKVAIPGRGHGSPVVWDDRVFVTTGIPAEGTDGASTRPTGPLKLTVLALDRRTGEVVWQRTAREEEPHEGTHTDGSWASASPATDGERVFADFGSRGLYAYDLDGRLEWSPSPATP
jgi:hypothetical protein